MPSPADLPLPNPSDRLTALNSALRGTHRSVLGLLAACAVVIYLRDGDPDRFPEAAFTLAAMALAVATIILRQLGGSRVMAPRARVVAAIAGLACGGALGLLGVWVAIDQEVVQPALGLALGGAILCLRPPAPLTPAPRKN